MIKTERTTIIPFEKYIQHKSPSYNEFVVKENKATSSSFLRIEGREFRRGSPSSPVPIYTG